MLLVIQLLYIFLNWFNLFHLLVNLTPIHVYKILFWEQNELNFQIKLYNKADIKHKPYLPYSFFMFFNK